MLTERRRSKFRVLALLPIALALAACQTPVAYRPQVDLFATATAETAKYGESLQSDMAEITTARQKETLEAVRPQLDRVDQQACSDAMRTQGAKPLDRVVVQEKCALHAFIPNPTEEDADAEASLEDVFDTDKDLANSIAFLHAVTTYAGALQRIATASDKEGLIEATKSVGTSIVSLAHKVSEATQEKPDAAPDLGAVSALVGTIAYYALEDMRAKALKEGGKAAQKWIHDGGVAVGVAMDKINDALIADSYRRSEKLLLSFRTMVARNRRDASYMTKLAELRDAQADLYRYTGRTPSDPIKKLINAHEALVASFDDPELQIGHAVSAILDMAEAAKEAEESLKPKKENKKEN